MTPLERREGILQMLKQADGPVSATCLARKFDVSRQIIVGDVALLRMGGARVSATPRGYLLAEETPLRQHVVACRHEGPAELLRELYLVVDNGCGLLDVIVEHSVYGQLIGQLQVFSRHDADAFLKQLQTSRAAPLSALTEGIHLHTLSCPSEEAYERVLSALREAGFLFEDPA